MSTWKELQGRLKEASEHFADDVCPRCGVEMKGEYNLELVWERFRALEDGRSIKGFDEQIYELEDIYNSVCLKYIVQVNDGWSLVPLAPKTRKVVTKLYVYLDADNNPLLRRYEENVYLYGCGFSLGAIEGSEQTHEEEV